MKARELCELARRLLSQPVAPFYEEGARAEVERICDEHGLEHVHDRFGNVIVHLATAPKVRPFVLAAHMDHPGFEIVRRVAPGRWIARFLGGVPDEFFRSGIPLRLMPGAVPARLDARRGKEKEFEVRATRLVATPPQFAVWELPDFILRQGRIHGRSCDDLIGVTVALATLIELKRSRASVNAMAVISRAEEVGFQGALAVAATRRLDRHALVVSLETSREMPPVQMGRGVIIRVGDRTSIFDSAATRYLTEVAAGLHAGASARDPFPYQRALMSGGTCEASAYQEFGFQTAAVCVALGNYHNCGPGRRIAAEYVDVADTCGMTRLLVAAAREMTSFPEITGRLPARLHQLLRSARPALLAPRNGRLEKGR